MIHVLDAGLIVESGSHSGLLAQNGVYAGQFDSVRMTTRTKLTYDFFRACLRTLAETNRGPAGRCFFGVGLELIWGRHADASEQGRESGGLTCTLSIIVIVTHECEL